MFSAVEFSSCFGNALQGATIDLALALLIH
jgi:hypothetical protein